MRVLDPKAREAVRRGHRRTAHAKLWNLQGFVADIPFSKGDLTFTLSRADGNRSGSLTVPGYSWFSLLDPGTYCWVEITVDVDGIVIYDLGEFPVLRTAVDRPAGTVEVQLGDWAYRRAQPMGEIAITIGSTAQTVSAVCQEYMTHVMPGTFTITRDDSNGALVKSPYDLRLGGNVWSALTELCNQAGCVLTITSRTTGEIRSYDPAAPYMDDLTGTVVRERIGILPEEAVNMVIVQLDASDGSGGSYRSVKTLTTGPYAYDQTRFGEFPYVEALTQPVASQAAADAEAQRIYDRRAGVVRTQAVDVIPQPWIEVGDILAWYPTVMAGPLFGMVETFRFPLTADGVQSITMRDTVIR